uniref:Spore coat protein U domain-containing protein n=1 Tax=Solibacter usitatus (strain Ellin6076) TaxID=234267 RepID=Q02AJ7_SOLUE
MIKRSYFISLITPAALLLGIAGSGFAQQAENRTASLVSIGPNVSTCKADGGGSYSGINKGVANVHYNAVQKRFSVNVSVHDALPNTTYVVDIRCWVFGPQNAIGAITTNKQGTGTAQIDLFMDKAPVGDFYIDIAVPPGAGVAPVGAGGYGDTYIAGPFNLQ